MQGGWGRVGVALPRGTGREPFWRAWLRLAPGTPRALGNCGLRAACGWVACCLEPTSALGCTRGLVDTVQGVEPAADLRGLVRFSVPSGRGCPHFTGKELRASPAARLPAERGPCAPPCSLHVSRLSFRPLLGAGAPPSRVGERSPGCFAWGWGGLVPPGCCADSAALLGCGE